MWIAGLVLILVGAGLGVAAMSQKKKLGLMEATETSQVAQLQNLASSIGEELGAGSFSQITEVKGTVVCDQPLRSELAGVQCVHYSAQVTREYEETRWETDAQGHREQRTHRSSDTVSSNTRSVPFQVDDGTGRIRVDPSGASITTEKALSRFEPGEAQGGLLRIGSFSFNLSGFNFGSGRRTLGYRYEEDVIPVGRNIYVLGEATDRSGELRVEKPKDKTRFIVSVKSEEELVGSAKKLAVGLLAGAAASGVVGFVLLVVGLLR